MDKQTAQIGAESRDSSTTIVNNLIIGSETLKPFLWLVGSILAVCLLISILAIGLGLGGALYALNTTKQLATANDLRVTQLKAEYNAKVERLEERVEDQTKFTMQVSYWLQRAEVAHPELRLPPVPQLIYRSK